MGPSKAAASKASAPIDEWDDDIDDEQDELLSEDSQFKLDSGLPDYAMVRMTTEDLHDLIHEGYVNLDPEYQRDIVWPAQKQIMLIDSLINNFYVPSVIFSVKRVKDPDTGEEIEERVCMDGKQRLTSIQRFMDGLIPWNHKGVNYFYDLPEQEINKRKMPLPLWLKKKFSMKPISCVEYQNITESDEREIFRRVQLGVALSPAEKLQGIQSEWTSLVRRIQMQYIDGEDGLGHAINWLQRRGLDFSCVAQILLLLHNYPAYAWPGINTVDKFLRTAPPPSTPFTQDVIDLFKEYIRLAQDKRYSYGFTSPADRVSPAEMVMIGLLLRHMRHCTDEQKAQHVNGMRVETRRLHKDVRMNTRVAKTMWEYILNVPGVPKAQRAVVPSAVGGTKKRKRASTRAEEEEFRPAPGQRGK